MNLLLILACQLPDVPLPSANYEVSCQEITCSDAAYVTVQDDNVVCYYSCVDSGEGNLVDRYLVYKISADTGCYYLSRNDVLEDTCPEW